MRSAARAAEHAAARALRCALQSALQSALQRAQKEKGSVSEQNAKYSEQLRVLRESEQALTQQTKHFEHALQELQAKCTELQAQYEQERKQRASADALVAQFRSEVLIA